MKKIRLEDIDNKTPFSVPEGYFKNLKGRIQEEITEQPKHSWLPSRQLTWAVSGASMALIVIAIVIFRPNQEQLSPEEMLADISEQALINYLDLSEVSDSEILDGLSDDIIENLWEDDELIGLSIDDEDIDDLLLEYEQI